MPRMPEDIPDGSFIPEGRYEDVPQFIKIHHIAPAALLWIAVMRFIRNMGQDFFHVLCPDGDAGFVGTSIPQPVSVKVRIKGELCGKRLQRAGNGDSD